MAVYAELFCVQNFPHGVSGKRTTTRICAGTDAISLRECSDTIASAVLDGTVSGKFWLKFYAGHKGTRE